MASRRLRVLALLAALAAATPALAEPTAAEKETARNLMQEGRDLRDKGELKAALQRFLAADQLMHVPTTGYEVASTQEKLGLLVEARETLGRVRRIPASPGEPAPFRDARQKADDLDEALDPRIPAVTVVVKGASGAKLTVDDVPVPPALVGLPLRLNPGHHVVVANTAASRGEKTIDVAEGAKTEVVIQLVEKTAEERTTAQEENAPPPAQESRGSYVPAILAFGAAGAGLAVGSITGAMTFAKQSDLAKACPMKTCGPTSYGDVDSANTLAMVSTISFIAAGACAALGVVLVFVGKPSAKPASAWVRPWVGPGSAGVGGAF